MPFKRVIQISATTIGAAIILLSVFLDVIQTGRFDEFGYFQLAGVLLGFALIVVSNSQPVRRILTPVFNNSPIILGSLLITLILVEIVLRQYFFPVAVSSDYRRPDPVLGWRLEPNLHITVQNIEFTVPIETNSQGWRDVEHSFEKPVDIFRILVLGDSFMEAYSVALDDAFHRQLEILINENHDTQVEVINLGIGGYGTLQEYLAFTEEGVRYQPDLVLLAFYTTNDVRNNSFVLESQFAEGLKVDSRPFLLSSEPDDWEITVFNHEGMLQDYEASRAEASAQKRWYDWNHLAVSRLIDEVKLQQARREWIRDDSNLKENLDGWIGVNRCQMTDEYQQAWEVTERILTQLHQEVQESGTQLVVFNVPGMHEANNDYMEQVNILDSTHVFCLEQLPGNEYLSSMMSELGFPLIDLVPVFRQAENDDDIELFRSIDQHWNEAGHALAAEQVYNYLLENNQLPR